METHEKKQDPESPQKGLPGKEMESPAMKPFPNGIGSRVKGYQPDTGQKKDHDNQDLIPLGRIACTFNDKLIHTHTSIIFFNIPEFIIEFSMLKGQ
jgi:hypothetical protein